LFPLKEWLLSWLPGHSFKWDFVEEEEAKLMAEEDLENMPIHQEVRNEKKCSKIGYVGQFTRTGDCSSQTGMTF